MIKKVSFTISSILVIFLAWILLYEVINHHILFPSLGDTFSQIVTIFTNKSDILSILNTLLNVVITISISLVASLVLGFIAFKFSSFSYFISPFILIFRTIPTISVLVIIPIIFGLRASPFVVSLLLLFPIMFQSVFDSLKQIDIKYQHLIKIDNPLFHKLLFELYLPLIKNSLTTTLFQVLGLAIKVTVMSEYLVQTTSSIGGNLYASKIYMQYDRVFAWTIILIVISAIFDIIPNVLKKHKTI
ncbi:MAG: hypothetical protein LBV51_04300 [Acholeplasmatales bacterium]|jgi:NitT/TauT family transport system permease protein|nr:hypothetical protein [Acholeplasmatales bacterium]